MPQWFHQMEIRSQLESLPRACRFVREFCQKDPSRRLAGEGLWQLELAVHEAAANIIRHAYENQTDQRILMEIEAIEEGIMVKLNHWGKPFFQRDPPRKPIVDGIYKCGFGLYLIERCVDRVTYRCNPDGKNIISLAKQQKISVSH